MANQFFNNGKHELGLGNISFNTADWRLILTMTGYVFATDKDSNFIAATTLLTNEYDGASYARQALASETYVKDAANNRSELNSDPIVFSNLGIGTNQCIAAILYVHVTNDADSIPFLDINDGGFPFDGTGSDNTVNPNAEGLVQI